MRLTKQTGHAIRILIECAQCGETLVKVADLSDRLGVTRQNVFKIVHILSHAGFVEGVRGPTGGVRLAKPADAIRVGDVVRAIEVTRVTVDDTDGPTYAESRSINLMLDSALTAFISVLDQHTLADLATASNVDSLLGKNVRPTGGVGRGGKEPKKKAVRGARRN